MGKKIYYHWSGNYGFSLKIKILDAMDCYAVGIGPSNSAFENLNNLPYIQKQFRNIDPQLIREELDCYGAWTDKELLDIKENQKRILWLVCGDVHAESYWTSGGDPKIVFP